MDTPIEQKPRARRAVYECFEWTETFLFALVCVILLFTLLCRVVTVVGTSMTDTLQEKDYLVISNLFYTPQTGDIVVIQAPSYDENTPLIKRVIATGGQFVDIDFEKWEVFVGDSPDRMEKLDEPYIRRPEGVAMLSYGSADNFPLQVEEGFVFVMGDNRNGSLDSRSLGPIDTRYIIGKAVLRLFPFSSFGAVA